MQGKRRRMKISILKGTNTQRETSCARTLQLWGPPQQCLCFPYFLPQSCRSRSPGCLSVRKTIYAHRQVVAEPD